jgi:DNA-binding NtrC family response regulator
MPHDTTGRPRAVLVGDDPRHLADFRSILEDLGTEAVACLAFGAMPPVRWPAHALVVLDVRLDPRPAIALGRELEPTGVPVVVMTGALGDFLEAAQRHRFRPFAALEKPYAVARLRAILWRIAGRASLAVRLSGETSDG